MANKEHKFFVLKLEDIGLYLDATERAALESIYLRVSKARKSEGREPTPSYVVCNQDEPYAEAVWDLILKGEDEKAREARALARQDARFSLGWRPILSAPKDGTPALLLCETRPEYGTHCMGWSQQRKRWEAPMFTTLTKGIAWWDTDAEQPTHWKPTE